MAIESILDVVLVEKQIFRIIESTVCEFEEIYYQNDIGKEVIGRSCSHCQLVQKYDHPFEILVKA
ncbi:hypothetical protein HPT25_04405 [Bacillus sp. BRMEA1]|uniref:hypothetical protein n=1 Tax=Neobacillus endophyticus TaxID=2738405 RepID=UPI00156457C2|nr:hypothetical protein [Neobacillus endophyticus]NRD76732.1 hypothetical protein [Neobacillus endophyticus]